MSVPPKASEPQSARTHVKSPLDGPIEPRVTFYGLVPASYGPLNGWCRGREPAALPELPDSESFLQAASTRDLDRTVKILPLPNPISRDLTGSAIEGMERLREIGALTALRGDRATDLPRPQAGKVASTVRSEAPGLVDLVAHIERVLEGGPLFVRAIKLDGARLSTTAPEANREAANLHFDAGKSTLAEYDEPVFQFYLNAGALERHFKILPVERDVILSTVAPPKRSTVPLEEILQRFLAVRTAPIETIPVASGALAVFDGRRFAHDAGKGDMAALIEGRFEPSPEPDLVLALDTVETGHHQGLYRPELPFFEDSGF